jgi:hypothetical protein
LAIAKDKIGKTSAERIEVPGEGVEPTSLTPAVCSDRAFEVGNDEANSGGGLQDANTFAEKKTQLVGIKVLEHVSGVDRVHRVGRKWQTIPDIQPEIDLVEWIAVDIQESRQIFWASTEMAVRSRACSMRGADITAQQVIGKRSLSDAPKDDVFVALVKQPFHRERWPDYSSLPPEFGGLIGPSLRDRDRRAAGLDR